MLGVLVHACNTSTLVFEAEELQQISNKTRLQKKIMMCSNVLIFHFMLFIIYSKDYFFSQNQTIFSY